jgi:hypothetical protein
MYGMCFFQGGRGPVHGAVRRRRVQVQWRHGRATRDLQGERTHR